MLGELSSALPHEGGYYAWVRRAMGDFWGFPAYRPTETGRHRGDW
jgi:amino acid transporter